MKYLRNVETTAEVVNPMLDSASVFFCQENQQIRIFVADVTHPETICTYADGSVVTYNIVGEMKNGDVELEDLVSCEIGNAVTSLCYDDGEDVSVFSECLTLQTLVIPGTISSIPESLCYKCKALSSVTIPDSVTCIGAGAFSRCSGLTSVLIPSSVTTIEAEAFYGIGMESLYNENREILCHVDRNATSFNVADGTKKLLGAPFDNCKSLTSVNLPNSLEVIGESAFGRCSGLTSVEIPNAVTSMGRMSFFFCTSLTQVTLPDSLTSIGIDCFYACDNLSTIVYNGTIAQWNTIDKGVDWNFGIPATVVTCTDGTVPLS